MFVVSWPPQIKQDTIMDDINIYRDRVALAFDIPCPVCGRKPKCEFTIGRNYIYHGCEHDEIFNLVEARIDEFTSQYQCPKGLVRRVFHAR